jgi:hypothetical protein
MQRSEKITEALDQFYRDDPTAELWSFFRAKADVPPEWITKLVAVAICAEFS